MKTIAQRSLIVGVVFGVIAVILAFTQPRAVLSRLPARLHVLAGRGPRLDGHPHDPPPHRRRLGHGHPPHPGRGHAHACRCWRCCSFPSFSESTSSTSGRSRSIKSPTSISASISKTSPRPISPRSGFIIRAIFYFAIWNLLSFLLSKWSKQTDRPGAPDNTSRFKAVAGPGLILYGFTISFAAIDWVMSLDPSWISTIFGLVILIGEVLSAMCFAVVVERILFNYKPMSEMLKPDFVHDHGKWMLTFIMVWAYFNYLAVAHHLGRQPAVGNHLLHAAPERRLGIRRPVPRDLPLRRPVRHPAVAPLQAQHSQAGLAGGVAAADALSGFVLDHRAEFLQDFHRHPGGHRRADCHRRLLAGLLLPQPGRAAAAAGLRSVRRGSSGADRIITRKTHST